MIFNVSIIPVSLMIVALLIFEIVFGFFMFQYVAFILAILLFLLIGQYTLERGFNKLFIHRVLEQKGVQEGQEIKIITIIENKKWLPISLVIIKQRMLSDLECSINEYAALAPSGGHRISKYSISWYERLKETYAVKTKKRGTYVAREVEVTIGDVFGFFSRAQKIDDLVEILVYPRVRKLNDFSFQNNSLQGEQTIRRWIHKDPLYIKGIREYNVEDRMKDIHWKSSLKMNKLMVKDYDYTSERAVVVIVNVYSGGTLWIKPDYKAIDLGTELAASLVKDSLDQGIPAGMWTNAQVTSYRERCSTEIPPSLNSFKTVLELGARLCYYHRTSLSKYLSDRAYALDKNTNYILITPFLDEESIKTIMKLKRYGYMVGLIDVSSEQNLPDIQGIEKVRCGERERGKADGLGETGADIIYH